MDMDSSEFQQFVVDKLINIENRLSNVESELRNYRTLVKIVTAIAAVLAAKVGVDLSGILT